MPIKPDTRRHFHVWMTVFACALLLSGSGCLYTTRSFNTGRLLHPGMTRFGVSLSRTPYLEKEWMGSRPQAELDTLAARMGVDRWDLPDSLYSIYAYSTKSINSFALLYRLGVLEKYPLGRGLEIGWLTEGPVALTTDLAASLECDARMGLKAVKLGDGWWNHNVSLGWIIGQWVDNTWFLEYSGGYETGRVTLYGGNRFMLSATDYIGTVGDPMSYVDTPEGHKEILLPSHRSFRDRVVLGLAVEVADIPVIPDRLAIETSFIFPEYARNLSVGVCAGIGFLWEFR